MMKNWLLQRPHMPPRLRRHLHTITVTAGLLATTQLAQASPPAWPPVPALIAHRGSSALKPEMSQPAFEQAMHDGADLLELDVVLSKDGVLLVRHDAALAAMEVNGEPPFSTTDVATHAEFSTRKTTKLVDGKKETGWFAEDFTLQELKSLRAIERFPQLRPSSAKLDGKFPLLTLQEVADLAKAYTAKTNRKVGLLVEIKHAAYLKAQGQDIGQAVLKFLQHNHWSSAQAPVFVMSFEVEVLKQLRSASPVRILQLMRIGDGPPDLAQQGVSYVQMRSSEGLAKVAQYAQGVALAREMVMETDRGRWISLSRVMRNAKAAGLSVHVWTLRPENLHLPSAYRKGSEPAGRGDALEEARAFLGAGVDGVITDDPGAIRSLFKR